MHNYENRNWQAPGFFSPRKFLRRCLADLGLSDQYTGRMRDVLRRLRRNPLHYYAVLGRRDHLVAIDEQRVQELLSYDND